MNPTSPAAPAANDVFSWCEVDAGALRANVQIFRKRLSPGSRLGVVVKSNAYGHGLEISARTILDAGADWLIVNFVEEAAALRAAGIEAPVYICGNVSAAQARAAVEADARVVCYDPAVARAMAAAARALGRTARLHIKVETGNYRQGLPVAEALALGTLIDDLEGAIVEGLTTHYADIEDTTDHTFAREQLATFSEARAAFRRAGIDPPVAHSANSAAAILWPETHGDLVRVGISGYGLWPSQETYATMLQQYATQPAGSFVPELRPALSWRTRVVQVKDVPRGAYIGYGRTFRATYPMRIAILPLGYHEGYDRRLSNLAHVLIHGVRAPVRGRVCMNMTMVDVTHIDEAVAGAPVQAGDVATLLGRDGEEAVSAEQLAGWMGTINYEVVSRIHPGLPRYLVSR